ncbi:MAG: CotH kinase family protein, partial [Planctomycetota bacterium]
NIWAQNHDWPGNNWYVARPIREGGRFRFLVWDAEFSFGAQPAGFGADSFQNVFRASGTSLADLFIAFLENERFQRYFLEEFQTLLDGVLSPENVLAHIRRLRNHVAPDMWEETAMVLRPFTTWEANVEVLEEFARNRGRVIQRFVFASPQITVPRVVRADPSEVEPTDEMEVTLRGVGFARGLSIEFGGVPAVEVRGESESRIVAVLPFDARVEGNPPITLVQADGTRMTTRGLLRVSMRPEIHSMEPARAAPGDIVTIRGRVFRTGMRVEFAGAVAEIVGSLTSDEVTVVVPPGGGRVPVRLVNVVPSALASEEVFDFSYAGGVYLRGDSDGDLKVSISDAVRTLRYLFSGSDVPCLAALDANTDGRVGLSDAVRVLGFLFQGVGTLSFPFPHCDVDPLPTLECATDSCSF